jgi:N-carbamoyl-D-amino-acid hydrolase
MARHLIVASAQMGPIAKAETRAQTVARLIDMMRQANARVAELFVFTEMALTTFFPRWLVPDEAELESYYETEMPSPPTMPLFDEAKRHGVGFYLGYAELVMEGARKLRFNTSVLVDRIGTIVGKFRKVHLPGTAEPIADRTVTTLKSGIAKRAIWAFRCSWLWRYHGHGNLQ